MPLAVIFDLNGTLVDSEEAHWRAYWQVLKDEGVEFSREEFVEDWVRRPGSLAQTLAKHDRVDLLSRVAELKARKDGIFRETLRDRVRVVEGSKDVVRALVDSGFRLGVDSTSAKMDIDALLDLVGVRSLFASITSSETAAETRGGEGGKADRFRRIAEQLGVACDRCLVVGDAEKDIIAARAAGMKGVAVPTQFTDDNDFSAAAAILPRLAAFTPRMAFDLLLTARHPLR